ncbi:hypothetical protein DRQ32_01625 [bacterium]|nr:MAG: hypothetical protein DRQ32_01625 [bacterium]
MSVLGWFLNTNRPRRADPRQFGGLFALMCVWLVVYPVVTAWDERAPLLTASFSLIAIQALSITARSQRERVVLVAGGLILLVAPLLDLPPGIAYVAAILVVLLLIYIPIRLSTFVLEQQVVDRNSIFGALCAYLFLGMSWALIYAMLVELNPASIAVPEGTERNFTTWLYFSFTTLSTLGYGDITPRSSPARMMAILEALIGQIYLVVVVARLVGAQFAGSMQQD